MKKRIGLMALLSVALLTATWPVRSSNGTIATSSFRLIGIADVVVGSTVYGLDVVNLPYGWKQVPASELPPIDPATILSYNSAGVAITDTGEGWGRVGGAWTDLGPVPGLVPTTKESWGQLKVKYVK
jgi:hypothetical protein